MIKKMIVFALLLRLSNLVCADSVVLYETDFSSDPGWTTNNPSRYFWDSSSETYFRESIDSTDEYSYKVIPGLQWGFGWRLSYDILPESYTWAGDARIGFSDDDMELWHEPPPAEGPFITVNFALIDPGYTAAVHWCTAEGDFYGKEFHSKHFSLGVWYHVELDWNPYTGVLYTRAEERDTGILLFEDTSYISGTFIGIDRLAMGSRYDYYTTGAVGVSWIDNITVIQYSTHINAEVEINPDTFNLDSNGRWVTCYIELPNGYDASDIDVADVLLEGLLSPEHSDLQKNVLMVKFDSQDLAAYIQLVLGVIPPAEVELFVTGTLIDGTPFSASDTIRVIK